MKKKLGIGHSFNIIHFITYAERFCKQKQEEKKVCFSLLLQDNHYQSDIT